MSMTLSRFALHSSGQPIKELITFLEPGEQGVEDTDERLRAVENYPGLWFFFQAENLLIDMTLIENNDGMIPPNSIYWSPYEAPVLPGITFVTEAVYNQAVADLAAANAAAVVQYEEETAVIVEASQQERIATLTALSAATGIPLEQLLEAVL